MLMWAKVVPRKLGKCLYKVTIPQYPRSKYPGPEFRDTLPGTNVDLGGAFSEDHLRTAA
jgi:hypothetical protein